MRAALNSRCVSFSASVSLLDFARTLPLDWDKMDDVIVPQLERMRYVDYVEDRHQFWIRLELDTGNAATAQRRITATLKKVEALLRRYKEPKS